MSSKPPPKVAPVPSTPSPTYTATFYLTDGTTEQQAGLNATAVNYLTGYAGGAWQHPPNDAGGAFYGASKLYSIPAVPLPTIINWDQVVKVKFF